MPVAQLRAIARKTIVKAKYVAEFQSTAQEYLGGLA